MGIPETQQIVNIPLNKQGFNEVTMRSVLYVHCSGFYWRDFHKFATILDMPPPLDHMPTTYLNTIESIVTTAAVAYMQRAANQLKQRSVQFLNSKQLFHKISFWEKYSD